MKTSTELLQDIRWLDGWIAERFAHFMWVRWNPNRMINIFSERRELAPYDAPGIQRGDWIPASMDLPLAWNPYVLVPSYHDNWDAVMKYFPSGWSVRLSSIDIWFVYDEDGKMIEMHRSGPTAICLALYTRFHEDRVLDE